MQSAVANRPHVVFYNLTSSGASAIVPILSEILKEDFGYEIWGDPSQSENYRDTFDPDQPRFHWTHSPVEMFEPFLDREDFRFICLVRDPRDVFVSRMKDAKHQGHFAGDAPEAIYRAFIDSDFFGLFHLAEQWLQRDQPNVMPMSFEAMKSDIPVAVTAVLAHLGLEVNVDRIAAVCQRHSFEAVTGRQPGEDGPILRNAYMYRTGQSGNWKSEFTPRVKQAFHEKFGGLLERWGYIPSAHEITEYRGYVVCAYEGCMAAFSPMLGKDFRVADMNPETMKKLQASGQFLSANSEKNLREAVDALLSARLNQVHQQAMNGQMSAAVKALKKVIALTGAKDATVIRTAEEFAQSQVNSHQPAPLPKRRHDLCLDR